MSKLTPKSAEAIALKFSQYLYHRLGAEQLNEINRLNALPENKNARCASHGFLDSGVTMMQAFNEVMGRQWNGSDTDKELYNTAWSLARSRNFSPSKHSYLTTEQTVIKSSGTQPQTVLMAALGLLGYSGGTIHQAKEEILKMAPMDRGIYLNKLKTCIEYSPELFKIYMAEYNPLRTAHLNITTL